MLWQSAPAQRLSYIDKEKDAESSLSDHGFRKYDQEIGRFTSIDPLWEKYRSLTPYHYGANNPLMYTDRSGDSIKIEYEANVPEEYRDFAESNIGELKSKGGVAREVVERLEQSKNVHTIRVTVNGGSRVRPLNAEKASNGEGSGTLIIFSIIQPTEYSNGVIDVGAIPPVILGHELGHADRIDQGKRRRDYDPNNSKLKVEEKETVQQYENPIRLQFGLPIRTHYGGQPVYTPTDARHILNTPHSTAVPYP